MAPDLLRCLSGAPPGSPTDPLRCPFRHRPSRIFPMRYPGAHGAPNPRRPACARDVPVPHLSPPRCPPLGSPLPLGARPRGAAPAAEHGGRGGRGRGGPGAGAPLVPPGPEPGGGRGAAGPGRAGRQLPGAGQRKRGGGLRALPAVPETRAHLPHPAGRGGFPGRAGADGPGVPVSPQTSQGVQVRRFKTLSELIALYLQPNQGLVCTLLFPVEREKEKETVEDRDYSDGEDEKPPLPPRSGSTSFSGTSVGLSPTGLGPSVPEGPVESTNGLSSISHEYLKGSYSLDLEAVKGGANSLPHLNKTLVTSCKRLHSEVDKVLAGLEILSKVFDQQSSPMVSKILQQTAGQSGEQELENLVLKLSVLKDFLSSIEKKALKALQEMSSATPATPLQPLSRKAKSIPVQTFEVKLDITLGDLTKIGKSQKYTLSVDVEGGKLVVLKKQKDSQEDWNTFTHDKIRQLIKSQRVQNKLGIVFEKEKDKTQRKDFVFVSARKREAFCQLLQLMKNKHSHQDEPDMISVFIGTWNMGGVPPPKNITSWITSKGLGKTLDEVTMAIPHDIYVFGTQENSLGDKEWVDFLRTVLKDFTEVEYRPVAMQSLWNIKVVVLVKPEHENRISHVSTSSVKTGIANTLGNKGAVGVSFMFNGTSFGFVNCHLTSGNEKTARRNQNYLDILRLLSLGDKQLSSFDISLRFTHLFWFGDLNYRLDMDIQEILNYISRKELEPLLKVDQLNLEKEKHKVFLRFGEEEITFPPTYRYERGSRDTYVWHKQKPTGVRTNVPSWCDRILWKSYPETHVNCNAYGCTDDIVTSDHSPVFGSFEVGVTSQFVSKKGLSKSSEQAYIEFESIEAIVKTSSRTKFFIEFYSTCLEEFKKSFENDSQSSDNINFLKVQWSSRQLPTLKPILSEIEYLQDQHLLLTVKSLDGYESYGECVIALKSMIGSTAQQFLTYLSHRGEETGNIRGSMKVRVPTERLGTRERLYEWISVDKDETTASKGKVLLSARATQDNAKSVGRKPTGAEPPTTILAKLPEEPEKSSTAAAPRPPATHRSTPRDETTPGRSKAEAMPELSGGPLKNSFNNPAYYVLEGVPHQLLAQGDPGKPPKAKVQLAVPERCQCPSACCGESDEEEDVGTLNLPPPDFPPPPLPRELELPPNTFFGTPKELLVPSGCEEPKSHPAAFGEAPLPKLHPRPPPATRAGFGMEGAGGTPVPGGLPAVGGLLDDRSCSVLQMAKTLSEVDYGGGKGRVVPPPPLLAKGPLAPRSLHPDYGRPLAFPPHSIQESIQEDLAEEVGDTGWVGVLSSSVGAPFGVPHGAEAVGAQAQGRAAGAVPGVGEWLRALGLERYEEGLVRNGWDDLEFLSDITEEDLEEAGVLEPGHKRVLLESLQLRK
ncbi:phosphatidylinositol 3,4,5-trisphosphate 5-phosphatase 2 isoform X1 [Taeniopygia guttata]|uniref:phosphatidylinositol 3,4,5-trisphosphate 5-phosphatase 2 isoform X1 n=1 Tax=Taeniopygia guttata TaxID=59729 RepID=UPI003BB9A4A5